MKLEMGDVLFIKKSKHETLFEKFTHWVITSVTCSPYYHCSFYYRDNLVFQTDAFKKAGFSSLDDCTDYDVKRLVLPKEVREKVMKQIISTEGSEYSWGQILSLFLRKKLGIHIFYEEENEFICSSELFDAVEKVVGIRIVDQYYSDVAPSDLWESKWLIEVS